MKLSEEKVNQLFAKYKNKACLAFEHGYYSLCLRYIRAAALTGYYFYLGYKDDDLESLLLEISKRIVKKHTNGLRNQLTCVFYDALCVDNQGLVQQYLNAIFQTGMKVLYITESKGFLQRNSKIKSMLIEYKMAEIIEVPSKLSYLEKAQFVYDIIIDSNASKLFIHTHPKSSYACAAFYALPASIKKYKINLTDHTFWIGTRFIDYSFEFRPFGCVLSANERGIDRSKLLMLPFYPIMNNDPFKGFPKEAEGKVVIFSGANNFKIHSKDDMYFKMAKAILDECTNAVLLYAGNGDASGLQSKIEKFGLTGRFVPIGYRTDIAEVFRHCDIFLNTYPIGGGLMVQYAAQLAKPILCYRSETTAGAEDLVCQIKHTDISDRDLKSLVDKAKHLVEDPCYRKKYGEIIQSCVVSPDLFNKMFAEYIEKGENKIAFSENVSYKEHTKDIQDKLIFENKTKEFQCRFAKIIGIRALWECPLILLTTIITIVKGNRVKKAIINCLK